MKVVLVCGTRDLRGRTLERLIDLGAVELHHQGTDAAGRSRRQALLRLHGRVAECARREEPAAAPETEPDDLVGFAERLCEAVEREEKTCRELTEHLERQRLWGDCDPAQVLALAERGVFVQCWQTRESGRLQELENAGQLLWRGPQRAKGAQTFATLARGEALRLDWADNLALPEAPRETLERDLVRHRAGLGELYGCLRWLARERFEAFSTQVSAQIDALSLARGRADTHTDEHVFVLSGWIPVTRVDEAAAALRGLPGVTASFRDPQPGEDPPTLTEYPAWARPIQSVLDFMGYRPGYFEYDAGQLVIVFFTVFSALLINDGGYGLLMLTALLIWRRRLGRTIGDGAVQLGLYVGTATAVYGLLTGSVFGVQFTSVFGLPLLQLDTDDLIRLSFGLGIVHLTLGRLIQIRRLGWRLVTLAEVGWLTMTWAVFLAILRVFTGHDIPSESGPLLAAGAVLVVLFSRSELPPGKAQLVGLGVLLGNATTLFSDMMSYIRIMAVGFASMSLAMTANTMAQQTGSVWGAAPILLLGHGINLGLGIIALFVHGLRLNTLEFARQIGVIWSGRPFQPLARFHWQQSGD
jgi:V/A-type H+-transporting ATPase subunit I